MVMALVLLAGQLAGCATPYVVEPQKVTDSSLDCANLSMEMQQTARIRDQAVAERGITGTNLLGLIWWPGLIATYYNTKEAIEAADSRASNLQRLYIYKGCHHVR